MKKKISISESLFLPPPHLPPFVEPFLSWLGEAFPYLNLAGILSSLTQIGGGFVWFEHRLKHDLKGPSYAMRSINNLERKAAGMTKRERFPALKKKEKERIRLLLFLPRPPPSGPR